MAGTAMEERDKPFNAVHCVILNTDWCGGEGHKGISQLWKRVLCCPGRFRPMSNEC